MNKLLGSLVIFQLLDAITTYLAISQGNAEEAMPIGDMFIRTFGLAPGLAVGKGIVILAVILLAYTKPLSTNPRVVVLTILNLFYAWVVLSNWQYVNVWQLFG